MVRMGDLSNKQQLILAATQKILQGEQMYNEGLLEFQQLTGEIPGRKQGSGGQNVSAKIKKLTLTKNAADEADEALRMQREKRIIEVIKTEEYASIHRIGKILKMSWTTVKSIVEQLVKRQEVGHVFKTRPGAKIPAKYLIML